jgi:hypothetical protein
MVAWSATMPESRERRYNMNGHPGIRGGRFKYQCKILNAKFKRGAAGICAHARLSTGRMGLSSSLADRFLADRYSSDGYRWRMPFFTIISTWLTP